MLPITSPPIYRGWVRVADDATVLDFGGSQRLPKARDDEETIQFPNDAILPALVNAHTHLELSDVERPIGRPGMKLADWIGEVIRWRMSRPNDAAQDAMARGMDRCKRGGVGLVADISPADRAADRDDGSTTVLSFPEVIGLSPDRMAGFLRSAKQAASSGISPHSPYSLRRDSIERVVDVAVEQQRTLAIHLAESPEERQLCFEGSGAMADALRRIGVYEDGRFPWVVDGQGSADWCDLIRLLARSPHTLIVHGNDLTDAELRCIAEQRNEDNQPAMTIVYCPRTHAYFGHRPHPIDRALSLGVPVALGTDSLASNPDLSIWNEVRYLLAHRTDIALTDILTAATAAGADALSRPRRGRIAVGARPGLIRVGAAVDDLDRLRDVFAGGGEPRWAKE